MTTPECKITRAPSSQPAWMVELAKSFESAPMMTFLPTITSRADLHTVGQLCAVLDHGIGADADFGGIKDRRRGDDRSRMHAGDEWIRLHTVGLHDQFERTGRIRHSDAGHVVREFREVRRHEKDAGLGLRQLLQVAPVMEKTQITSHRVGQVGKAANDRVTGPLEDSSAHQFRDLCHRCLHRSHTSTDGGNSHAGIATILVLPFSDWLVESP